MDIRNNVDFDAQNLADGIGADELTREARTHRLIGTGWLQPLTPNAGSGRPNQSLPYKFHRVVSRLHLSAGPLSPRISRSSDLLVPQISSSLRNPSFISRLPPCLAIVPKPPRDFFIVILSLVFVCSLGSGLGRSLAPFFSQSY